MNIEPARIRAAWQGRISGCLLGKPLEVLSFREGATGLTAYLEGAGALPLRDYVPLVEDTLVAQLARGCCRGHIRRAEPDDDINYTILALLLLEEHGSEFQVADVARKWLNLLPAGATWTAERAAYGALLANMQPEFVNGADPGFDLAACSDNDYNDWIGAQIRADLYGWVCPGRPALAADLVRRDASLSHRGEGVFSAMFIAALAAAIPAADSLDAAIDAAMAEIPDDCKVAAAVQLGRQLADQDNAIGQLRHTYAGMSPVHSLNNLSLVVWAVCSNGGDFSATLGDTVAAGWDTDCNGATVGGLLGLAGAQIPRNWTDPWDGRIGVSLAGFKELQLADVVDRTVSVAKNIAGEQHAIH